MLHIVYSNHILHNQSVYPPNPASFTVLFPAPLRSVVDVYGVVSVVYAGGDGECAVHVAQGGAPLALLGQAAHPPPRVPGGP